MTTVSLALAACNEVADLMGADPETAQCMRDAARERPRGAYTCYKAILDSYRLPARGIPISLKGSAL